MISNDYISYIDGYLCRQIIPFFDHPILIPIKRTVISQLRSTGSFLVATVFFENKGKLNRFIQDSVPEWCETTAATITRLGITILFIIWLKYISIRYASNDTVTVFSCFRCNWSDVADPRQVQCSDHRSMRSYTHGLSTSIIYILVLGKKHDQTSSLNLFPGKVVMI